MKYNLSFPIIQPAQMKITALSWHPQFSKISLKALSHDLHQRSHIENKMLILKWCDNI